MKKLYLLVFIVTIFATAGDKAFAVIQKEPTTEQRTCVKTAITVRDTAVKVAYASFIASLNTVFDARTNAIKNAWDIPTSTLRIKAINTATKNFQTAKLNAKKTLNNTKKTTWSVFNATLKNSCSVKTYKIYSPDVNLEGADNI